MADEKLSWQLQFDLVGDGLSAARAQMDSLQQSLAKGQKAIIELESNGKKLQVELQGTAEKATGAFSGLVTTLGDVVSIAKTASNVIMAPIRMLDQLGNQALAAFGERQGTLRAYTTLLGSATAAQEEFGKAQALALRSDLTSGDVEGAQKSLMVAGFRGRQLDQALLATMDLATMASPQERTLMRERVARGLSQVFSKGKLQGEELRQLSEAGLSRRLVLDELGRMGYGGSADAVEKSITKGKVSADAGIVAIEQAILKQFNTQKLGQYATGSSASLSTLISNVDEGFKNLFKSFDSELLPGVERYKAALRAQGEVLDVNTKSGQDLSLVLQDLSSKSLELKASWTQLETGFLKSFSEGYAKYLREYAPTPEQEETGKKTNQGFKALGQVTAALVHPIDTLNQDFPRLSEAMEEFYFWLKGYQKLDEKTFQEEKAARRAEEQRKFEASQLETGDYAGPWAPGNAKGGGLLPGDDPWVKAAKENQAKQKEAAKSARSKGGGGLGEIANFKPDYSGLEGGLSLPMVNLPGVAPSSSLTFHGYQAQTTADVRATLARPQPVVVQVDNVTIEVTGDMDKQAVADKVAEVLRGFGRLARTPSPAVP